MSQILWKKNQTLVKQVM